MNGVSLIWFGTVFILSSAAVLLRLPGSTWGNFGGRQSPMMGLATGVGMVTLGLVYHVSGHVILGVAAIAILVSMVLAANWVWHREGAKAYSRQQKEVQRKRLDDQARARTVGRVNR